MFRLQEHSDYRVLQIVLLLKQIHIRPPIATQRTYHTFVCIFIQQICISLVLAMNTFISDAAKFEFCMYILFLSSLNTIGLICFQFYFNVSSVSVIPEITVSILNPIPKLSSTSLSTGQTSVFELEGDAQVTIASTGSIYIGASPSSTITGKVTQLEGSSLVEAGHAT